jgi:hypothetical protein
MAVVSIASILKNLPLLIDMAKALQNAGLLRGRKALPEDEAQAPDDGTTSKLQFIVDQLKEALGREAGLTADLAVQVNAIAKELQRIRRLALAALVVGAVSLCVGVVIILKLFHGA